jgi:hypothetical protein
MCTVQRYSVISRANVQDLTDFFRFTTIRFTKPEDIRPAPAKRDNAFDKQEKDGLGTRFHDMLAKFAKHRRTKHG